MDGAYVNTATQSKQTNQDSRYTFLPWFFVFALCCFCNKGSHAQYLGDAFLVADC